MKKLFISDLKNLIGKEVEINVLLKNIMHSSNREGLVWQDLSIADKTGDITCKIWMEQMREEYYSYVDQVVKIIGKVNIYRNLTELEVIDISKITESQYDWKDYADVIPEDVSIKYQKRLIDIVDQVQEHSYNSLLKLIFDKKRIAKLAISIGGIVHHNYYGGLLVHLVDTCEAVIHEISSDKYRYDYENINHDIAIAGALLHDIGKLNSYSSFPKGEKSLRGELIDSSVESVLFATVFNNSLPKESRVNDLSHLDHILLTAESNDKSGKRPKTLESLIVNEANRKSMMIDGFKTTFLESDRSVKGCKNSVYSNHLKTTIIRGLS